MNIYKSCFVGTSAFKRLVKNENISIDGTAIFEPLSHKKHRHTEKGHYMLSGQKQEFFQIRYYIFQKDYVIIQKQDGTVLHEFHVPLNPSFPITLHHLHPCNDDSYEIRLKLLSVDEYHTEYIIKGPKKNEVIQTVYKRTHL